MNPSVSNPTGAGSPSSIVSNKRNHTPRPRVHIKPYICVACGRWFVNKKDLKIHMRRNCHLCMAFAADMFRPCQQCGEKLGHRQRVESLFRSSGYEGYECKDCFDLNGAANSMSRMRIRTEETVYPCKECRKSFTTKQNLNSHRKTHPEKGGISDDGFIQPENLETQTMTDTGETAVDQYSMDIGQL